MFSSFSEPHSTNNPLASSPQSSNQDSTIPPLVRTAPTSLVSSRVVSDIDWIVNYKLPRMPFHIKAGIDSCSENIGNLSSSMRREINKWLFNDIIQYTLYPSSLEYNTVAIQLVREFPFLADKNDRSKLGTWVDGIRQKFRDARRPMTHIPEVMEMKKRFGTKHPRPAVIEKETTPAKRRLLQTEDIGEDEHSMAAHTKDMEKELKKNVKNVDLLRDRMNRTFLFRQKECQDGAMTLNAILEKYPAFQYPVVIFDEANRIFKLDLQHQLKSVDPSLLAKLKLKLKVKLPIVPAALLELLKGNEIAEVLCLLPLLFNNKLSMYIECDNEVG
ncbi:sterile alpha motif domain-containing protein 3-like isoform X2 [Ciona intestinalis]